MMKRMVRFGALCLCSVAMVFTWASVSSQEAPPAALTQAWVSYQGTLSALGAATQAPATQNPAFGTMIARTIAANQTSLAVLNPTAAATLEAPIIPMAATFYVQGTVNVRACPRRNCAALGTVSNGQALPVNASTYGEVVKNGNPTWYRFGFNGRDGFIYSEYVSAQMPPTAPPAPAPSVVFQGSAAQVLGPVTFGPGLYRARVTTSGYFIAELQITQGNCEAGFSTLLFALFEGQANGAEATIRSEGCTTFIEISNITAPWRLEISQIG